MAINDDLFEQFERAQSVGLKSKAKEALCEFIDSFNNPQEKATWVRNYLEQNLGEADFIMDAIGQHSIYAFVRYYQRTNSIYLLNSKKELLCVINLGTSPATCSECTEKIKTKLCPR